MNRKMIRYTIGTLLMIEAILLMVPALVAAIYQEGEVLIFLCTAAGSLLLGLLARIRKPENTRFYATEGYITVALCWIIMSLVGSLPLLLSGYFKNPFDALFEIVSGFTTTGASVCTDVEALPKSLLMWRSLSHWIGGMGVLVFILAVLPVSGASSMHLMRAESPGPSVGKLVPKVRKTASMLYKLYIMLTVLEIVLLMVNGLPLFDSVNLSLATAGTGGFGLLGDSCASYSPAIKITLTVFMIAFGVNFNVYFFLYTRDFKDAFKCEEARAYLAIILASSLLIFLNIRRLYADSGKALIDSFFQVGSIITTTGFTSADFDLWPEFSRNLLVMLMFIGACAGSTGGGIKVSRILIMAKTIGKELSNITHPRTVRLVHLEGKPVEHEVVRSVNVFVMAYIFIFTFSLLIVSLDGNDFTTSFTAVAATINNIGPGLSGVGPMQSFAHFSNLSKAVLIFDMLAGRLELFPILVLLSPGLYHTAWHRRNSQFHPFRLITGLRKRV